ncbi:similar to Saccharomyces cerevisiae YDL056W MBP1 Transcription factor involved in regulation of cell cycle progression from G1 to S phase [Maudiozyma saulgeensis]|uniref:Transcription factor MBP1 n=1 Tax=Maudiozyma saulgeensis TaxID=1789683 RepID=A0A1X7QZB2_9SACH|nr:similar to Saccharomyces cerevisiae YDL056W MBP1 Transcription factor involved in regulation of cell cycle progression from G1 to S phase [Kazachstania saulgeensis]
MSNQIYSAKYSGVDVYEFIHPTGSIMKRKKDDWVNATHILKAANFAKARRTRILEKEVLKETHEKVQGGFGKYQGTWVPLNLAENLAKKFSVYEELKPLFDYKHVAGMESPPPAPKHHHTSRADSKKKATKSASMSALTDKKATRTAVTPADGNPVVTRRRGRPPKALQEKRILGTGTDLQRAQSDMAFSRTTGTAPTVKLNDSSSTRMLAMDQAKSNIIQYKPQFKEIDIDDGLSSDIEPQGNELEANKNGQNINTNDQAGRHEPSLSVASSPSLPTSPSDFSDANPFDQQRFGDIGTSPIVSSIPKYPVQMRPPSTDINDKVNNYLSKLVDYFISNEVRLNKPVPQELLTPPANSSPYIDAPIDPELHTAFHWACSMGNLSIVEALSDVGVSTRSLNSKGQTPLMRSAMFHNSYTKRTFPRIFQLLHETVFDVDSNSQTVIHHIIKRKSTTPSAVYYLEILLSKIKDFAPQYRIELLLNVQDNNGDTALHIAARNNDKTFFDILVQSGALTTTQNREGLTPDAIMNMHYQEQLNMLDNNQVSNVSAVRSTSNRSHNILNLEGAMMSPGDFVMYPSQAATRLSRGFPKIIKSMKDLAEQYNENHTNQDKEVQNLEKTLEFIKTNIKGINSRTIEILNNGDKKDQGYKTPNVILLTKLRENEKLISDIKINKQKLRDDMNKRQRLVLNKHLKDSSGIDIPSGSENRLKLAVELSILQGSRKRKIDQIISIVEDNLKIHKYRKMISEGTEIAIPDVDNCLDVILQTLSRSNS